MLVENSFSIVDEAIVSFYSATKGQKAFYESQQNTILYSAYIHTCMYTLHVYRYVVVVVALVLMML